MRQTSANRLSDIIARRRIDHIVHCTPLENLASILRNGILPASFIGGSDEIHAFRTDALRLDENLDASCFSIQEPSFQHLRRICGSFDEAAVLFVSLDVLFCKACAFYPQNASNREFRFKALSYWKMMDRFEEMFAADEMRILKDGVELASNLTTYESAEVHVFGGIETRHIEQVAIRRDYDRDWFEKKFPHFEFIKFA